VLDFSNQDKEGSKIERVNQGGVLWGGGNDDLDPADVKNKEKEEETGGVLPRAASSKSLNRRARNHLKGKEV